MGEMRHASQAENQPANKHAFFHYFLLMGSLLPANFCARMPDSKKKILTPTEVIDWLNDEDILELDWDFPEQGSLAGAGLDAAAIAKLLVALEDRYHVELETKDLTDKILKSPTSLAAYMGTLIS